MAVVLVTTAGCTIPSYHLPAGFSSSYQRQVYGMEPVPSDSPQLGLAAVETRRGIFYPTTVFHDGPAPTEQAENKPVEPLFLSTDPLTSKQTARRSADDAS